MLSRVLPLRRSSLFEAGNIFHGCTTFRTVTAKHNSNVDSLVLMRIAKLHKNKTQEAITL